MTTPPPRVSHNVILFDPIFAAHDPGPHVETPDRVRYPMNAFTRGESPLTVLPPRPAPRQAVERVHAPSYVEQVKAVCHAGGGPFDPDTFACRATYDAAIMAAGAGLEAVRLVEENPDLHPFCLVRPPGHHAVKNAAMGFCFFNNIAVTAAHLTREQGVERVLIVDFDVHHGNGTQDAFYEDPSVHFLSHHRYPFYPGTGSESERGAGAGLGTTTNLPTPLGTPTSAQLGRIEDAVASVTARFVPEWVLVSAGFDGYAGDPVGNLGWQEEDYHRVGRLLGETARNHAKNRLISFLEGGYNVNDLPGLIRAYLTGVDEGRHGA